MTDERLAREHTAWLASVFAGHVERENDESDESRHATPEEVAAALGRRERELTPADAATFRREPDDPEDEREPSSEAKTASGEFVADLRRQRGNRPPEQRTPQ